jgi:hypothetical protein
VSGTHHKGPKFGMKTEKSPTKKKEGSYGLAQDADYHA